MGVLPIAILIFSTPMSLYPDTPIPWPQLPNHFARVNHGCCVATQGQSRGVSLGPSPRPAGAAFRLLPCPGALVPVSSPPAAFENGQLGFE